MLFDKFSDLSSARLISLPHGTRTAASDDRNQQEIDNILREEGELEGISARGRELVENEYGFEAAVERYSAMLSSLP